MLRPEGTSFAAVVAERARAAPSHPAILYQDQTISYGELVERAAAAARALMAQGRARGVSMSSSRGLYG